MLEFIKIMNDASNRQDSLQVNKDSWCKQLSRSHTPWSLLPNPLTETERVSPEAEAESECAQNYLSLVLSICMRHWLARS